MLQWHWGTGCHHADNYLHNIVCCHQSDGRLRQFSEGHLFPLTSSSPVFITALDRWHPPALWLLCQRLYMSPRACHTYLHIHINVNVSVCLHAPGSTALTAGIDSGPSPLQDIRQIYVMATSDTRADFFELGGRQGESKLLIFVCFDIASQRIIDSVIAIYLFCFSSDKWSLKCLIQP